MGVSVHTSFVRSDGPIAAFLALLLFTSLIPLESQAESNRAELAARRALSRGDVLRRQGRHDDAIDVWRAGLRALPHWSFLLRIGDAYRQQEQCGFALPYLRMGHLWRNESFTDSMLPALEEAISSCRETLPAQLDISSNRGAVTVYIDEEEVGTTPLALHEVSPGVHSVRVEREGYEANEGSGGNEASVRAVAGEVTFVRLNMTSDEEQNSSNNDVRTLAAAPQSWRRSFRIWGGVLLGSGIATAGVGGWLMAFDGQELQDHRGIASMGPGAALAVLGSGLIGGGIILLVLSARD